ncbi:hypothetical protein PsW64_02363 [Pseudovibrio sp. W64]|uniref:hypothetical protein n=1 Tax=Pseudovibrio sp. W64 TaxID=1735583 RepID=UPI0007AE8F3E|nr:hypothetical protein [Pseudovibrio sp. W64]KZK81774.1 hypothetical protein PsW64_02363 [Pseudovibrio sp. W64]
MNNRNWNQLVAVAAGTTVAAIFLATITHIPIHEWAFWEKAVSTLNLSILLGILTLIFVLRQISIAQEDNALLKFSLAADFLDFLYKQEDIAVQCIRLSRMIGVLNHEITRNPHKIFAFEYADHAKHQKVISDKCTQLLRKMDEHRPAARKYFNPDVLKKFDELYGQCDRFLAFEYDAWVQEDKLRDEYVEQFNYAALTYETTVREMIARLEPRKNSALGKLFSEN